MSEVVYYEFGTHDLQVVPSACLIPRSNYLWVDRPFAYDTFNLIDRVAIDEFETRPIHYRIERGNKHIATLHWDERIAHHFKYERSFLVGPMDIYLSTRQVPRYMNPPGPPDPPTDIPALGSTTIVTLPGSSIAHPPYGPSTACPAQGQPYGSPTVHPQDLATAHPPYGSPTVHPQDLAAAHPPYGSPTAHPQDLATAHPPYGSPTVNPQDLVATAHPPYAPLTAHLQDLAIAHILGGPSTAHLPNGPSPARLQPGSSYTHPPGSSTARPQLGLSTASSQTEPAPLPHYDERRTPITDDEYEEPDSP